MKKAKPIKKIEQEPHDSGLERASQIAELSLAYAKKFVKKHKLKIDDENLISLSQYLLDLRDNYAPYNRPDPRDRSSG